MQKNIHLFHGPDTYSSNEKLRTWKNAFIQKYGDDTNVEIIEGKKLEPKDFESIVETVPFLSEKRLVIIKDFLANGNDEKQKKVAELLIKAQDFSIVVFHEDNSADKRKTLYKKLKKIGSVLEFKELTPPEITNWIINNSKKRNLNIDSSTSAYLANYAGPELWKVSQEVDKLSNFSNGEKITKEMIHKLSTPSLHASIFKLTDSISEKNLKESLEVLQNLADSGEDLIRVFFMIVRHFRILLQVNDLIEKQETAKTIEKKLKQHPFVIKKTSQQSRNFNTKKLEKIYQELLDIDVGTKTGKIKTYPTNNAEFQLAIEQFIIHCCK